MILEEEEMTKEIRGKKLQAKPQGCSRLLPIELVLDLLVHL